MKTTACIAAGLIAAWFSPLSQATVVPGDWRIDGLKENGITTLALRVFQSPGGLAGDGGTGEDWRYDIKAGTLTWAGSFLDEGATFFVVSPGQAIGQAQADAAASRGKMTLNQIPVMDESALENGDTAHVFGNDFWLGVGTTLSTDPGFPGFTNSNKRTSFGWAHIRSFYDGTFTLMDSAMAYRESGIVVGTLQAIPEPGTWAMMGLGVVGLAAVRRRTTPA
jgi:hypothetical protein